MNRVLKFPGQKPGEEIQLLVRKHWIIDVKIAITFLVFGVLPFGASVMGIVYFYEGAVTDNLLMGVLAFLLYFLITLVAVYVKWLNEELDVIIITNERVIAHDQIDLFHREISETSISQVQDVIGIEKGILGHLFHFGQLRMQTAAHHIVFEIHNVGVPYVLSRQILDIRDKFIDKEKFEHPPGSAV
jgi:hypothetical protein